jgi:two-component system chemotaxis response regulator CheB
MHSLNIIAIGASAGGVETLTRLVKQLPPDLPAAILVVLHFPSYGTSVLPKILDRCHTLPALHVRGGETIQHGQIYIAPPNHHLLLHHNQIRLSIGPRENGHRPAIDTMFRSAAHTHGRRVIGVILSGMLDDGSAGLAVIKAYGGIALVQDPQDALFDGMPRSAIENVDVDAVLKLSDLAARLVILSRKFTTGDALMSNFSDQSHFSHSESDDSQGELSQNDPASEFFDNDSVSDHFMLDDVPDGRSSEPPQSDPLTADAIALEAQIVAQSKADLEQGEQPETSPSMVTCPDCGGVLWEVRKNNLVRFRCHVGHAYSIDSLLSEQANSVETALWSAVRALEEKAALARRMAERLREQNYSGSAERFDHRAKDAAQQAQTLRQVIASQTDKDMDAIG